MAFVPLSFAPEFASFAPAHVGMRPSRPAAASVAPPAEIRPVVHLIHGDEQAARNLAGSWEWLGAQTRVHIDAAAFIRAGPSEAPGCLIVHVRHREEGLELLAGRAAPRVRLPMIVTTEQTDVRTVMLAMRAGAIDFFETPVCDGDLGEAVENAIRSDRARRDREARQDELLARFGTLTPREREVMGLVTQGLLNKQVAGDLGLSEVTVKVHRGSAMRKMAARSIADLVRMADVVAGCLESAV
jgi:FixJ family two-component response regulator